MNKYLKVTLVAAFISSILVGCSQPGTPLQTVGRPMAYTVLKPGEKIGDMLVTSGVKHSFPLWSFCLPTRESDRLITADCSEVPFDELAIGHTFGVMDLIPASVEWEELNWQLSVDGWALDLEAFGTRDFVHPDLALNSSPIREVFRIVKVWDVILVHPAPGAHTLRGQARSEDTTYSWIVNFTVGSTSN